MKTTEERKAEIMRRAEIRIRKRKSAQRRAACAGLSLGICLCITVGVWMRFRVDSAGGHIAESVQTETVCSDELTATGTIQSGGLQPSESAAESLDVVPECSTEVGTEETSEGVEESTPFPESFTSEEACGPESDAQVLYVVVRVECVTGVYAENGALAETECTVLYSDVEATVGERATVWFPSGEVNELLTAGGVLFLQELFNSEGEMLCFADTKHYLFPTVWDFTASAEGDLREQFASLLGD